MREIILAVLASGAVFSFVQFLITLGFSRKDKSDEIEKKIDKLNDKIDKVAESVDENAAILARTHILRFSDEIKNGMVHSSEYWRQQLDDCDTYQRFCDSHPNFKNSYTEHADKHIKDTYDQLKKEGKI
jgi:hypothetical protein